MVKVNILSASIGAALLLGTVGSAQAATSNQDVASLKAQVAELQQLVQQLSNQQQQQAVQLQQQAQTPPPPPPAPVNASTKPGWITLPDGQTQLKVYGNVRVDAAYDFDGTTSSTSYANSTGTVPLNKANATKGAMNVTAATSRLGVDVVRPTQYGDLIGKIEADFAGSDANNSNGSFRVRHAYMSLNKWLVGQTTSPFVNADTAPDLIDFTGPMGTGTQRNVQVRYTQPTYANQKLLVALEGGQITQEDNSTTGGKRFPALTARYDIATADKKGLLQLHAMGHENRVSSNDNNDEEKWGWGVGIGGKYQLTPQDAVMANYYHVKGDSRYMLYANQNNSSYTSSLVNGDYNIYLNEFDTAQIGYQRKWAPQWRSTFSLAGMKFKDDNAYARNNQSYNKTLYNAIANLIWSPVNNVDLGAEYTYGQRKTFAGDKGDISRLNLMARYSF